ncbi:SMP-30/gluconolactonase/LRE family protein [Mycobacterium sp. OTB74]|uniref:SMP-30/gluconolactonase/LRE family protein n=1 Tax=Mycobacterium sp. OTB74 TaxID=1853452 RepID=UPI002474E3FB|nr:SMP-30/gluconolactonase/LRE family protein [Mycobacterium sp. OTB74]MDH6244002.1 gluconolactonase [Mycobacterium sp. OTB74]
MTDVLADGLGFTEGPALLPDGRIAVTSISHGCVYVVDLGGGATEKIVTGGGANGLVVSPDGTMYIAQNGGIFGASGAAEPGVQVIRDGRVEYLTAGMDAPNDLVFGPDGRLWVTDTRAEIDFFNPNPDHKGWVWAVDTVSGAKELVLADGPIFINGLGFSPDFHNLMVTTTCGAQLWQYPVGSDGSLGTGSVLHTFENGWPDGMAVCADGGSWVALTGGHRLDLISTTGERVDSVALPDGALPTNVCLGRSPGELFVAASRLQALVRVDTGRIQQ